MKRRNYERSFLLVEWSYGCASEAFVGIVVLKTINREESSRRVCIGRLVINNNVLLLEKGESKGFVSGCPAMYGETLLPEILLYPRSPWPTTLRTLRTINQLGAREYRHS
jgi:hypothetical protein